jgi:signal transduction histidine kinase
MLANRLPSILVDKDDQLWISGTGGLMRLDTRNMLSNPVAPVAGVQGISTPDGRRYEAMPMLALPAGAHSFNIHYTAASLRQPEGVRFQYRLDGEDNEWRDAGTRRTAYYTNMAPGSYRFQVRAINEDGVWSAQPASIAFDIPPTVTQTLWFKVLCALAGGTLLTLLYRYRLRRVTARLEERMEVRVAERERIARTLHDTFLQSVQGVVLRLDTAVDALPDDSATRKTLAPILHSARGTIAEGRAQVLELRAAQVDDVESLLGELAALLQASYPGTAFGLTVSGERALLLPRAAEEIREIAREAVRNAFQHAQAGKIDARLTYGDPCFTLLVRDDGVGMPPAIPGFNAHFGLVGMRERAARIGGTLRIDGAEGGGVRVTLTVPARCAYAGRGRRWWHRLWDRLRG